MKDKKRVTIANPFQSILKNANRMPSKIWTNRGSGFYNTHFKKWLKDSNIETYSTHNEGKSVAAERFIRTLKNKIYKHITVASKKCVFQFFRWYC